MGDGWRLGYRPQQFNFQHSQNVSPSRLAMAMTNPLRPACQFITKEVDADQNETAQPRELTAIVDLFNIPIPTRRIRIGIIDNRTIAIWKFPSCIGQARRRAGDACCTWIFGFRVAPNCTATLADCKPYA
jgi:hypothetical protein